MLKSKKTETNTFALIIKQETLGFSIFKKLWVFLIFPCIPVTSCFSLIVKNMFEVYHTLSVMLTLLCMSLKVILPDVYRIWNGVRSQMWPCGES